MKFADLMGMISGAVIVTALFLFIGVYAIFFNIYRIFKVSTKTRETFWVDRDKDSHSLEDAKHQF